MRGGEAATRGDGACRRPSWSAACLGEHAPLAVVGLAAFWKPSSTRAPWSLIFKGEGEPLLLPRWPRRRPHAFAAARALPSAPSAAAWAAADSNVGLWEPQHAA